ncbi:MAG: hypothetical protein ACXVDA_08610, partial [Ktedonobacterales bacterium]
MRNSQRKPSTSRPDNSTGHNSGHVPPTRAATLPAAHLHSAHGGDRLRERMGARWPRSDREGAERAVERSEWPQAGVGASSAS